MKARVWVLLSAGLLALAALAAACGGGGDGKLSLEDYFQRLDKIQNNLDSAGQDLDQPDSSAPIEEQIAAGQALIDTLTSAIGEARGQLDGLDPPNETANAHGDLLAALTDAEPLFEGFHDRAADVETSDELDQVANELFEGQEATDIFERFTAACLELQGVADGNSITVDLACNA